MTRPSPLPALAVSLALAVGLLAAPPARAVTGGVAADPAQWPGLVSLAGPSSDQPGATTRCTGTVVSPQWVLTAAHCLVTRRARSWSITGGLSRRVRSNRVDLTGLPWSAQPLGLAGPAVVPSHAFLPPAYDGTGTWDVALVHLARTLSIAPAQLPTAGQPVQAVRTSRVAPALLALGFGASGPLTGVTLGGVLRLDGTTLRVTGVDPAHDVSAGDDGGPLLWRAGDAAPWTQLGVLSSSRRSRDGTHDDTYANLGDPAIAGWIARLSAITEPAQPAPPRALTATGIPGGVRLAWTPAARDGGSPVTGYVVSTDGGTPVVLPAGATSYEATGLSPDGPVRFTVAARNALGDSDPATATAQPLSPQRVVLPRAATVRVTVDRVAALDAQSLTVSGPVVVAVCTACQGGETTVLGPQPAGAEVTLLGNGAPSTDPSRARILARTDDGTTATWTVGFEDGADFDFNDLVVVVTATRTATTT